MTEEEFLGINDDEPESEAEITDDHGVPVIKISKASISNEGEIEFDNDTGRAVYITMTASYSPTPLVPHTVKVGS
jgi:hypothetical protein